MRRLRLGSHRFGTCVAVALVMGVSSAAQAACTSPAGNPGDIVYSSTSSTMAYCNGTSWVAMGANSSYSFGTVTAGDFCVATSGSSISCNVAQINLTSQVTGILPPANGGTGVANSATITVAGNFATSGAYPITLTATGTTTLTLPTSGTLTTGTGTADYVARWTGTATLGTGVLYDTGTLASVGTTTTASMLGVYGGVSIGTTYVSTAAPTNGMIVQGYVGIGTTTPAVSLDLASKTDALALPVGTTGTRPTGANGYLRYNTTTAALEGYINGAWASLLASGGSGVVTGSGTANYVARWTDTSALGTGVLYDTGTLASVGTTTTASMLGVYGGVSIGTTYVSTAAPTNGLIVQGNVGIGTSSVQTGFGATLASGIYATTSSSTYQAGSFTSTTTGGTLTTGAGAAIYATASGASNSVAAIYASNSSTTGAAIYANGGIQAVNNTAVAVYGTGSKGVYGNSSVNGGMGVYSLVSTTGTGYGVNSQATGAGNSGYAVYGVNSGGTGTGYGGYFTTNSTGAGTGLYASETGAGNTGYAAYILNSSSTGWGVYSAGTAPNYFAGEVGVGTTVPSAKMNVVYTPGITAASSSNYLAGWSQITANEAYSYTGSLWGHLGRATIGTSQTAPVSTVYGAMGDVYNYSTATQSLEVGVTGGINNMSTGTVTGARALSAVINNTGGGTITTGYGLYIGSIAGTTSYGVYQAGGTYNYFAGSVGIGTTVPAVSLDLATKTDALALPVGTTGTRPTAANGYIRYNSTTPGVEAYVNGSWVTIGAAAGTSTLSGSGTANYVARWTGTSTLGTGVLYDTGTLVGIGTVSPLNVLHVVNSSTQTAFASIGTSDLGLVLQNSSATTGNMEVIGFANSAAEAQSWIGGINVGTTATAGGRLVFGTRAASGTAPVERMRIDESGNVGIGTATYSNLFTVYGNANYGVAEIMGGGTDYESSLSFRSANVAKNGLGQWLIGTNLNATPTGAFSIWGGSYGNVMTFTTGGNVGIGTTVPGSLLHVYGGNVAIDGTTNPNLALKIGGTSQGFLGAATAANGWAPGSAAGDIVLRSQKSLLFATNGASSTAAYISTSGNIGIGTTGPAVSLDLASKTDALALPVGTTGARPTGANGYIRYNSTTPAIEAYVNGSWQNLLASTGAAAVTGTGTANYVARWTGTSELGTGVLYDNGSIVGIGTASPVAKLDTYGSIAFGTGTTVSPTTGNLIGKGSVSNFQINIQDGYGRINYLWNASSGGGTYLVSSEAASRFYQGNGDFAFYGAPTGTAGNAISWTEMGYLAQNASVWFSPRGTSSDFYISSAGNVGVGTTGPASKLLVQTSTQYDGIALSNGTNWVAGLTGLTAANDNGLLRLFNGGATNVYLVASGSSYLNGGNVGIGTTNPASILQIGTLTGSATASPVLVSLGGTYGTNTAGTIGNQKLQLFNDGTNKYGFGISGSLMEYQVPSAASHAWFVNGAEKMRVDSSGNVGIGTTVPNARMNIVYSPGITAASSSNYLAGWSQITANEAYSYTGSLWGHLGRATIGTSQTAPVSIVYGAMGDVYNYSTATQSLEVGVQGGINNMSTGTVTGARALSAVINNTGGGTITTGYGLYIGSIAGTTSYGVYQAGGTYNYFAGSVGIGTTVPAVSLDLATKTDALALPVGTTGTRPTAANGYIRYNSTTPGVEAYVNGSWVTLGAAAGTSTLSGSGTANYVARWTGTSTLGTGVLYDTGSLASVGTTTTASMLGVYGGVSIGTTYVSTAAPTNGLIVQGNVGIGTLAPGYPLDVYATTVLGTTAASTSTILDVYQSNGNANYFRLTQRRHTAGSGWGGTNFRMQRTIDVTPQGFIDFGIDGLAGNYGLGFGSGSTTTMVLTSAGLLGIGTTAPEYLLDVNGIIRSRTDGYFGYVASTSGGTWIVNPSTYGHPAVQSLTSSFGGDSLLLNPAGGNVGVGTNAPAAAVDVIGTSTDTTAAGVSATLSLAANTASAVKGVNNGTSGLNYGVYGVTYSSLSGAAGVYGVAMTSSSNYGVYGVASSGFNSAGVRGQTTSNGTGVAGVSTSVTAVGAAVRGSLTGASASGTGVYGEATGASNTGAAGLFANSSATGWSIKITGTSPSYFASNVGIGTPAPGYPLDVYATTVLGTTAASTSTILDVYQSNGNANYFRLTQRRHTAGSDWGGTNFRLQRTIDVTPMGFIDFGIDGLASNLGLGFGSGSTTSMVLTSAGLLGIGTTVPVHRLDVVSSVSTGGGAFTAEFYDSTTDGLTGGVLVSSFLPRLALNDRSTSAYWADMRMDTNKLIIGYGANTDLYTRTGDLMTITTSGNVGIGSTAPAYTLDVSGPIRMGGLGLFNASGYRIIEGNGTDWIRISQSYASFSAGGTAAYGPWAFGNGGVSIGAWNATIPSGTLYVSTAVGIGTTAPAYPLDVLTTDTTTTGTLYGARNYISVTPTAASSGSDYAQFNYVYSAAAYDITGTLRGSYNQVAFAGTSTLTYAQGAYNQAGNSGTGAVTYAYGSYNYGYNNTTGSITTAFGSYGYARNVSTGTIGTAYGSVGQVTNSGTGSITTARALSAAVTNSSTGTITTGVGLYIGGVAGTTSYGIYQTGGSYNYFASNIGVGSSAPASGVTVVGEEIQPGTSGTACSSTKAGAIRWTGAAIQYCNGTAWTTFADAVQGTWCGLATKTASLTVCSSGTYTSVATCSGASVVSSCPSGFTQQTFSTSYVVTESTGGDSGSTTTTTYYNCQRFCIKN